MLSVTIYVPVLSGIALALGLAAESALQSYSPSKLDQLVDGDTPRGRRLAARLQHFDSFAQSLSLFNLLTTVVLVGTIFWRFDVPQLATKKGVLVIVGLSSGLGFGFYGVLRGMVALRAERAVVALLGVIVFIDRLMYPLVAPLNAFCNSLGRLSGTTKVEPTAVEDAIEEFRDAVVEGEAGGVLQESTAEIIENIIEFKDRVVHDVMTSRTAMVCLRQSATFEDVIRTIGQHGHTRYPVFAENRDNIVGMLYVLDLFRHYDKVKRGETSFNAILRKAVFVPETKRIDELLEEFRVNKVHVAVVHDEFGGTAGLVTVQDIVQEIVGDLEDEFGMGKSVREIHRLDANRVEFDAKLTVEDLNDQLKLSIPSNGDYDTIGGFLAAALGKVPAKGENFEVQGVRFEVTDADERKAKRVRVTLSRAH